MAIVSNKTAADKSGGPPATNSQLVGGADIVVQSLVNHGVDTIFAYPGGASMPLHQALTRFRDRLRTILPRHEQGGGFAAQGYARSTGKVGVCMATSGPGATNLVTAIADAKLDSIPLIAITGQVGTPVIGTDAFQETPIVEVCRSITKHHYLVTDVNDIARVMREAFHIATTGRPGPGADRHAQERAARADRARLRRADEPARLSRRRTAGHAGADRSKWPAAIQPAKRPVIYAGGGVIAGRRQPTSCASWSRKTGIPVTTTLMGLGAFPGDDPLSLDMLGMHGSVYANYAVDEADLLLALGVRFDDRVTGKVAEFAKHGKIVHIDIDPSEINKNKKAHIPIVSDVKYALAELNKIVEPPEDLAEWHRKIARLEAGRPVRLRPRLRRASCRSTRSTSCGG